MLKNQYEVLEELNLVIIKCRAKEANQIVDVYVDYDIFNKLQIYDVEWKEWGGASGIATTYKSDGDFINLYLKKIIGEILFDERTHLKLLDDSTWDLRKCNLFDYQKGYFNSKAVKIEYEKRRKEHKNIMELLKNKERSNFITSKIRPLYDPNGKSIILSKNQEIIFEISQEYANEIYTFLKANPSYLLKNS